MRTLLATLMIAIAVAPFASANHGCTTTSSTQTHATLTIDETSYGCHYTYFGTDHYQESTWSVQETRVSESTTGAQVRVVEQSGDAQQVSNTYGSYESTQDSLLVEASVDGRYVGVAGGDYQVSDSTYGCYGSTGASAGVYSDDGSTSAGQGIYRGDARKAPCVPQGLREML